MPLPRGTCCRGSRRTSWLLDRRPKGAEAPPARGRPWGSCPAALAPWPGALPTLDGTRGRKGDTGGEFSSPSGGARAASEMMVPPLERGHPSRASWELPAWAQEPFCATQKVSRFDWEPFWREAGSSLRPPSLGGKSPLVRLAKAVGGHRPQLPSHRHPHPTPPSASWPFSAPSLNSGCWRRIKAGWDFSPCFRASSSRALSTQP